MSRSAATLAAAAAVLALGAAPASAAPTRVVYEGDPATGARVLVAAAAGEANDLDVRIAETLGGRQLVIADHAAGVGTLSPFCTQFALTEVRCDAAESTCVTIRAGDLADRVITEFGFPKCDAVVDGGGGADDFRLGFKPTDAESTIGQVRVLGGDGNDRIVLGFRPADVENVTIGQIVVDAGDGNDALAFRPGDLDLSTVGQIHARLGPGNDLATGVLPNLLDEPAAVGGGDGEDLTELGGPVTVRGGAGGDTLAGGAGSQRLFGGGDDDTLSGGDGEDFCHGGTGTNTIAPDCERSPG